MRGENLKSKLTIEERFWTKVNKNSGIFGINGNYPTECWIWTATKNKKRYGRFWPNNGSGIPAHRYSYILTFGKINKKIYICHKCDNPPCVNPEHLFSGTQIDNMKDMDSKNRRTVSKGESHGMVKLNEKTVLQIRKKFKNGSRYCELAKEFNISHGTIMDIVKRRSWKHI